MASGSLQLQAGIRECSKCEHFLRCEECVYNKQSIELHCKYAVKDFASKLKAKLAGAYGQTGFVGFSTTAIVDETLKEFLGELGNG